MNGGKFVVAAVGAPIAFTVVVLTLVLGGGGAQDEERRELKVHAFGDRELNQAVVPPWARAHLAAAATRCSEITAPILAAQIETESNWNPNAYNATSKATGLSQFIPSTWAQFGTDGDGDGRADPRNAADAITSQAKYMCHLVEFVKGEKGLNGEVVDLALASYNAGPGNVKKFNGIPPFMETTNYVAKIRTLASGKYAMGTLDSAVSGRIGAVIEAAAEHVAKRTPYAWGGGTLHGPSAGMPPDRGVVGFDCSSLVRFAYYQGTNQAVTLPRVSQAQFDATKSRMVDVAELRPGDLLFWGSPTSIHHVALFVGGDEMIEAPRSGLRIARAEIRLSGDFVGATRVLDESAG